MRKTVGFRLHKGRAVHGKGGDESTDGVVYMIKKTEDRERSHGTPQEEVYEDEKVLLSLHLTQKERYGK